MQVVCFLSDICGTQNVKNNISSDRQGQTTNNTLKIASFKS